MTKQISTVLKPSNGGASKIEAGMTVVKPVPGPEPQKPEEQKRDLTLQEKILKVENLQLIVEKRARLVQTRSELERFQTASNDFNCSLKLNDSDGNSFVTNFTPGIKKVIEFLKTAFDTSIKEVEGKIDF